MSLSIELGHDGPPLDFSAELPDGALTALVGPSGSGKTSILRAIAGLLRVRRERVTFAGEAWSDSERGLHTPTRLRPVGLVPQSYALFPHLTVLGNVETSLSHLPRPERRAQALRCLELAHIDGLEDRYPHQLSGGQKQRVALGRAVARQPKVLLLDEPFSAVDRSTRKRLYVELRRLHEQLRTTVILVTHDLDEAAQLASHLVLVRRGRSLQSGPAAQVLTRPCCEDAARLLDIPNVFEATVEASSPDHPPLLRWGPHALRAAGSLPAGIGERLKFAVLPPNVLLVRSDKPWGGHLENPIPAIVEEVVELGGEALVWLRPDGLSQARMQMRLPARAMRRYGVEAGKAVIVSLREADVIPLGPSSASGHG